MEENMEVITVNGKTYYSSPPNQVEFNGSEKIVNIQRGWLMVGVLERNGSECKLHNASVIRVWGTSCHPFPPCSTQFS